MEPIKQKRQKFNILLHYGHLMEAKPHILAGYGAESTKDLTEKQLDELIIRVQAIINKKQTEGDQLTRQWRHKCLRMMHECGVDTHDWEAVNAFCMDKRIAGKHLYELTTDELQVLHRKLHNVRDRKAEKAEKIENVAFQN